MSISFNQIPVNLRTPGVFVEFDPSKAVRGLTGQPYKILVIGQRLTAGTVAAGVLQRVFTADEARTFFGQGSMLHLMFAALKANNRITETWAIALDDNGAGVASTGSIKVGGAPTAAGTLNVYIAGTRIQVAVSSGAALSAIASALNTAINADGDLPVTSVVNGTDNTKVDLTARNKGEVGNDIDLRVNYQVGETLPAGLTVTITAMSGGTSNPAITPAITAMAEEQFNVIAFPYRDATSLLSIEAELLDRWGPMRSIEGMAFIAATGSLSTLTTLGNGRNSQFVSIMGSNKSPSPTWAWAASIAAVAGFYGQQDPARPFQTLPLKGILPPAESDRFTRSERDALLNDGIATAIADEGGVVRIERLITTYQTNAAGAPDTAFLDANTVLTLGFLRFSFRNRFSLRFPRHKLADDGNNFGAGQAVVTPKIARAETIALFRQWEDAALVENLDQFKQDLLIERSTSDPNRLDIILPPDLVNQLRVTAAKVDFLL